MRKIILLISVTFLTFSCTGKKTSSGSSKASNSQTTPNNPVVNKEELKVPIKNIKDGMFSITLANVSKIRELLASDKSKSLVIEHGKIVTIEESKGDATTCTLSHLNILVLDQLTNNQVIQMKVNNLGLIPGYSNRIRADSMSVVPEGLILSCVKYSTEEVLLSNLQEALATIIDVKATQ